MAVTTFVTNGIAVGDWVGYKGERYMCMRIHETGLEIDIEHPRTRARFIVDAKDCKLVHTQRTMYQILFFTEDGDEDYYCWAASPAEAVKLFKGDHESLPIYKVFEMREIDRELWDNQPET